MAEKKVVRDSEGERVVTAPTEEPKETRTVNAAAREAYEAELAADAEEATRLADAEKQEEENARIWRTFIERS